MLAPAGRIASCFNREPRLPPGAGDFQVVYAALSYLNPEEVHFKYMLEGLGVFESVD
jgi:hypothetical protein